MKTMSVYQKTFGNGERRLVISDNKNVTYVEYGEFKDITSIEILTDHKRVKIDFDVK